MKLLLVASGFVSALDHGMGPRILVRDVVGRFVVHENHLHAP